MRRYGLKNIILHPFLLGLYPVIALLGHNITEVRISEATRALLFMFMVVAISVIMLRLGLRSWRRAALPISFIVVLIFSYGYLYDFLHQNYPDLPISRHRFLIPLYFIVMGIGLWWIKKIRDLDTATQALNLVGIIAIIFPLYQIISHGIVTSVDVYSKREEALRNGNLMTSGDLVYPDVYYIILDAYPRNDVLQDVYGFDNSEFLNQLSELGFYIAECSQSNYSKTSQSLPSSLNLNYLDVLAGGDARNLNSPATWIRFSEVKKILDSLGYSTIAFSTGYPDTELTDVDIYLQPDVDDLDVFGPKQPADAINNFEALLISTSGLVLMDALKLFDIDFLPTTMKTDIKSMVELSPMRQRYVHVLNAFNELDDISSLPAPKFVFAHIISPHNPYIFSSDGTYIPQQEQNGEAHNNQLTYVNQRVIPIVTEIIENSHTPPIIIIQGDHGSYEVEYTPLRVMILNAYYLPNGGEKLLYNTITPVNTFRLILDYYFGSEYGLIEDISYNSKSEDDLFDFELVPNLCDR